MTYDVQLSIVDPRTCKAIKQPFVVSLNYVPDYEDIVNEFFRQWDNKDKYRICYAIGVESMNLHDNKN